jgi:BON domain
MMVELKRISTALGLLAALTSSALAQGTVPNANQVTADSVAGTLRSSRDLAGSRIEILARDGVVTLSGELGSPAQKAEALARTQYVAGVRSVVDQLRVSNDRSIRTVQYQPNLSPYQPNPAQYQPNPALALGLGHHRNGSIGGDVVYGDGTGSPMYSGSTSGAPTMSGSIGSGPISDGGPVPEGPAGMAGATQASQPGSPNYAWPSYAPYPNFSAVGYPTAYPWQAWPNIGPFYPYPEVPLDWRAVTLRWDDGIWWLDFKKHYTRPFFTPYPFGLFAY